MDRVSLAHPAVLESATVGAPDEKRGEMVKSFIVCAPGKTVTAEELRAHGKAQLAPYKVPSQIEFRSELPKSSMMKVLRRELKAKA